MVTHEKILLKIRVPAGFTGFAAGFCWVPGGFLPGSQVLLLGSWSVPAGFTGFTARFLMGSGRLLLGSDRFLF